MESKECPICYDELILRDDNIYTSDQDNNKLNNSTVIELTCGHKFHYKCISMAFKNMLKKYSSKKVRNCPFCRCDGGFLPLELNTFPTKNINKEYELIKEYIYKNEFGNVYKIAKQYNFISIDKCQAILTSGVNKGNQCKKSKKPNETYCCIHIKKMLQN
jgi:hypothetical protein